MASISAQSPATNAINVSQTTMIFFHVGDPDGINQSTLEVAIKIGSAAYTAAITAGNDVFPYDGSSSSVSASGDGYDVTIDYRGRFPITVEISVRIDVEDSLGNPMTQEIYSFTTDNSEPTGIELIQIAQG